MRAQRGGCVAGEWPLAGGLRNREQPGNSILMAFPHTRAGPGQWPQVGLFG